MSEMDWNELDRTLSESLPELPPDDVVVEVTPWKRAIGHVLAGLALTTITLNFLCLQYILPAVGMMLMLLGFRALRRENRAFAVCYVLTLLRSAFLFVSLILNATILPLGNSYAAAELYLTGFSITLQFVLLIFFAQAIGSVRQKAGTPDTSNSAKWLPLWFALVCILALIQYSGIVIGIALIAAYVGILRNLFRLSEQIDTIGYAIETSHVRISDGTIARIGAVLLVIGLICGYLFGGRYLMDWSPLEQNEHAQVEEIKNHLLSLGFPQNVLDDLSSEDIAACDGALRVAVQTKDHAVNKGREVRTTYGNHTSIHTVYNVKELRITGVGVEIPGEREQWRIFHHFEWIKGPGFFGTECIQLWPTSHIEGWMTDGVVTGRLLCERDGVTDTAPYWSLGSETFTSDSFLWGPQTNTEIFAAFSLPKNAERQRGYLAYTAQKVSSIDYIIDSWVNYTHQQNWFRYPVLSAKEAQMAGFGWSHSDTFITIQAALQFYPTEEDLELIG